MCNCIKQIIRKPNGPSQLWLKLELRLISIQTERVLESRAYPCALHQTICLENPYSEIQGLGIFLFFFFLFATIDDFTHSQSHTRVQPCYSCGNFPRYTWVCKMNCILPVLALKNSLWPALYIYQQGPPFKLESCKVKVFLLITTCPKIYPMKV